MTKVISYANIALNFTADTGGIYQVRSEIGQLTRQAKSQMSDLEKFIHQLRVISDLEKKGQYSAESIDQMRRVASNAYLDMAKKSGGYVEALRQIGGLVPALRSEVDQLSFAHQREAESIEKANKKEERRAQLLQMVQRLAKEHIRLSQERDKVLAESYVKEILAQQDAIAKKQATEAAYIAKTKQQREAALADMHVKEVIAAQDAAAKKLQIEADYIAKAKRNREAALADMYVKEVLGAKEARRKELESWLQGIKKRREEEIKLRQEQDKVIAQAYVKETLAAQDAIAAQEALIAKKRRQTEEMIAQKHVNDTLAAQDQRRIELHQMLNRITAERFRALTSHLDYEKQSPDRIQNQNTRMIVGMTNLDLAKAKQEATRLQGVTTKQLEIFKKQSEHIAKTRAEFAKMNSEAITSGGVIGKVMSGLSMGGVGAAGFATAGVIGGTIAITAVVIRQSLQAYSDMRSELARLEVQMGSTEVAFNKFNQMRNLASRSPLMTNDLLRASVTLNQYGFEVDELIPSLKQLMDVSAGNSERFRSLALAYGQARAAGRLMGQETLQFINAGWNPLKTIARETGIEFRQLKKMMEEGQISFESVADALYVETQPGGKFYGMTEKLAGEYSAKVNHFSESWTRMKETIGELAAGPVGQLLEELADQLDMIAKNIMTNLTLYRAGLAAYNGDRKEAYNQFVKYLLLHTKENEQIKERKNLFGDIKDSERKAREEQEKAILEATGKEAEKARAGIKDLQSIAKLEEQIAEIKIGKRDLAIQSFAKEANERMYWILEEQRILSRLDRASELHAKEEKRRTEELIAQYKKLYDEHEKLAKIEEQRKNLQKEADKLLSDIRTPEQELGQDIMRMAAMIQMGMITQKQAMQSFEKGMKDDKKDSSGELPRLIKAGTVEAYQEIYGQRAKIQEQQLAEQKKQADLQKIGNKLLEQLKNTLEQNLMGLVD